MAKIWQRFIFVYECDGTMRWIFPFFIIKKMSWYASHTRISPAFRIRLVAMELMWSGKNKCARAIQRVCAELRDTQRRLSTFCRHSYKFWMVMKFQRSRTRLGHQLMHEKKEMKIGRKCSVSSHSLHWSKLVEWKNERTDGRTIITYGYGYDASLTTRNSSARRTPRKCYDRKLTNW